MVSSQEPVPTGVFASDQHKPSVRYVEWGQIEDKLLALGSGADHPLDPSYPEVMELDEGPVAELDHLAD